ncbi:PTS sugar transporter subunit IIA [Klebsiella pneumoniae subsp. pneumoniae]|nr:PTS sugar transporter subunit IIA [Klebsiella pneumoniae subsp. pneumoniae]
MIWGDEEAQFVIMLTLNKHSAGDQHMRIFSRLARRIMHAEFRQSPGIRGEQRGYCRPAAPRAGTVIVSPASAAGRRASYKSSTNRPPLAREQQISILCWLAFSSSL